MAFVVSFIGVNCREFICVAVVGNNSFGRVVFALTAKNDRNYAAENVYNVSILSLMLNVGMVVYGFSLFDMQKRGCS